MATAPHHAAVWLLLRLNLLLAASTCLAADDGTRTISGAIGHSGRAAAVAHPHEQSLRALLVVGGRQDPEVWTVALTTNGPSYTRIMHV